MGATAGRRRRAHGRRGRECGRRDSWGIEGDSDGVLQGRRLVGGPLLVEALVADPRRRASVTDRLCSVAFLAQPQSLSPTPGFQSTLVTNLFFSAVASAVSINQLPRERDEFL